MVEKKIVDDYYSSLKKDTSDSSKQWWGNQKIKAKKIIKKVVKKVEDKSGSSTISDSKNSNIVRWTKNIEKENSKKSFQRGTSNTNSWNKKTYIKNDNSKTRGNNSKVGVWSNSSFRKDLNNSNKIITDSSKTENKNFFRKKDTKKPFVQRMQVVKTEERKSSVIWHEPEKKASNTNTRFKSNSNYRSNSNYKKPWEYKKEERQKNYGEDKQKGGLKKWERKTFKNNNSAGAKWVNWKLTKSSFSNNKTRGRFKFYERAVIDTSFTRSNKIDKKPREEKKIEDIKQNLISKSWGTVILDDVFSLKEFSEKMWVPLVKLIAEFMKNGMMVNINSKIDFDSACIISEAFDIKLQRDNSKWVSVKDLISWNINDLLIEDDDSVLEERPPVVSIMGHVDHGKTSLLDSIRKWNIADWEAGWITQSIWAYQVEQNWKKATFLDTPGHEAFTVMRSRWAKATDIAILVVAADEWVKPQTIESINHAKEAGIPIIVAINKMDKEWANPDHIKGQLSEHWLTPEDWGWDTPMIPVSAKTWFGIEELIEIILLVAEMKELKVNPNRAWVATVVESHLDSNLGPVATVLVNTWNINKWEDIVCWESFWKIRTMKNFEKKGLLKAVAGDPVLVIWLDKVVNGWDILQVVASPSIAKTKANEYSEILASNNKNKISGLDILMSRIKAWNLKQLKVLIKSDTNWSLEAIKVAVSKLSTSDTNVIIIHSWVGSITEWDVLMVKSSQAILIWFNVGIIAWAKKTLDNADIEYIDSKIIYHITERIEKIVSWMLDPKEVEVKFWQAKVWGIFYTDKDFMIVGLILKEWVKIEKNCEVRVIRKDKKISSWKITSLKQWIEEVKELEWPIECWVRFEWKWEILIGDIFELYKIEIQK